MLIGNIDHGRLAIAPLVKAKPCQEEMGIVCMSEMSSTYQMSMYSICIFLMYNP